MDIKYQTKDAYYFNKLKPLFPYLKMTKGFIAGGVFKDIFLDKPFRDIDFFLSVRPLTSAKTQSKIVTVQGKVT